MTTDYKGLRICVTSPIHMSFINDNRGVSEVLGAILVFGILIAALGVYQAFVVPSVNEEAEFRHSVEVQQELVDLRSIINSVEATGSSQSKSIQLGAEYPSRVVAVNPPTPIGTLQTTGESQFSIDNAIAIDSDENDYWTGVQYSFDTSLLMYEPRYNLYRGAPTTFIDNSVVYHTYESDTIVATGQKIIQGNTITLGALGGDRSFSDQEANIEINPISENKRTVPVRGFGGENITIEIPTQLPLEKWEGLLEDQLVENGGNVEAVEEEGDSIIIELRSERDDGTPVTYNLRMSKVGIGPGLEEPGEHYIVRVGGDEKAIEQNQAATLTAEVRDKFNNPVSGVDVTFSVDAEKGTVRTDDEEGTTANGVNSVVATTDNQGQARVIFEPDVNNQRIEVEGTVETIDGGNPDRANVRFNVGIGEVKPSGIGGDVNPADGLIFMDAFLEDNQNNEKTEVVFRNTLLDRDIVIEEMRLNVYVAQSPGSSIPSHANSMEIEDPATGQFQRFEFRGPFEDVDDGLKTIPAGEEREYIFRFLDDGDELEDIERGDFFMISVIFEDGTAATYIIVPW